MTPSIGRTEELRRRFDTNLERCTGILESIPLFDQEPRGNVQEDMLRAVVVFLHASLEDLLRSILSFHYQHHPIQLPEVRRKKDESQAADDSSTILSSSRKQKRRDVWDKVVAFDHSKSVSDFIDAEIREYMRFVSYSSASEISTFFADTGLRVENLRRFTEHFVSFFGRRHDIVHYADMDRSSMSPMPATIDLETVVLWRSVVEEFGQLVIGAFDLSSFSSAAEAAESSPDNPTR